ncbi:MAG: efflux RND transporter periplasmic adaptor subunit [Ignavibacteriaceae bacterium]|nr:efflux RND transporter periplasmic adaptor subunit [Ignavibacteriaceae bacterium]
MKKLNVFLFLSASLILFGCGNGDEKQFIDASGTIESTNIIVSSRTAGDIQTMNYNEGDRINAGDTILIVDHDLLNIQLRQAIAGSDAAEAQLKLMQKGARKEDIKQAEENLKQTEVNFKLAESDKGRMQNLYESRSITKKQFDDAMARFELMSAQYNSAKENLSKVKQIFRPEEIDQAKANLNRSAAGADLIRKNIDDSYVVSPINGFLVKTFVERGETVTPMSSLFKVSDLDIVELVIYVSENELGYVKLGQKAEITMDTYKDKKYEGKITYISPEAEFTPKNIQTKDERTKLVFAVKIQIPNPQYDLKPGMPADARVILNNDDNSES